MSDRIEKSIELKAPQSRVWKALTDHREFGTWFGVRLDGPFMPGQPSTGQLTIKGLEHIRWSAMVQKIEPERYFAYKWHPYAKDPKVDYSGEPMTFVEFFHREGMDIVLVGHKGHVEVEGTMGHAPQRMHLVQSVDDVAALEVRDPERLGCVTQTTLSVDDTREILEALRLRFPAIRLPRKDDICYATQNRQNAVKELTERAEVVIVVGAPESSNSSRLVELAGKRGARAHLVQTAAEIDPAWIEGARCVGVTAGASAPEVLVEEVVARLEQLAGGRAEVSALPPVDEGVTFQLPAQLR